MSRCIASKRWLDLYLCFFLISTEEKLRGEYPEQKVLRLYGIWIEEVIPWIKFSYFLDFSIAGEPIITDLGTIAQKLNTHRQMILWIKISLFVLIQGITSSI